MIIIDMTEVLTNATMAITLQYINVPKNVLNTLNLRNVICKYISI